MRHYDITIITFFAIKSKAKYFSEVVFSDGKKVTGYLYWLGIPLKYGVDSGRERDKATDKSFEIALQQIIKELSVEI
jgi:hypothetical protein